MDQQEYDDLETKDPDVYYMTHGTESNNGGIVSSEFLETNYYNQEQIVDLFNNVLQNLFTVSGKVLELDVHALDIIWWINLLIKLLITMEISINQKVQTIIMLQVMEDLNQELIDLKQY